MAEADWTYLNDGLDIATVDRGVTAGIARPPGGGSFLYAFNSLSAVEGACFGTPRTAAFHRKRLFGAAWAFSLNLAEPDSGNKIVAWSVA